MSDIMDERIAVVAGPGSLGVTLTLGDVQVSVKTPAPSGAAQMSAGALRIAAVRSARRALEVAIEELTREGP